MTIPAIVAHGGAGAGPDRLANVERAVAIAAGILASGGSAVDAAVEACGIMEDTPNPIRVAADLLDEEINGLTGEGARTWADAKGFVRAPVEGRPPFKGATDTVGVIARDRSGAIVCATSTGGCSDRPPGRVGDVPLPGCGFWAQEGVAVGATGIGEAITRGMISYRVAERIIRGKGLEESMMWAMENCLEDGAEVGIIALSAEGTGHGAANSENMPWSSWIARK